MVTTTGCLDDLDDDELDRLPFGVVCLSPAGTIVRFNRTEATRSGIPPWQAIGRDYFHDVVGQSAPELADRVRDVAPGSSERMRHTFRRFHHVDEAVIDVTRCEAGRVYLCIRATSRPI
jgi:photoactive yellow protein